VRKSNGELLIKAQATIPEAARRRTTQFRANSEILQGAPDEGSNWMGAF
jgi:hypothetical protein